MAFPQQYGNLTTHGSNLALPLRYKPFYGGSFVTNTLAYNIDPCLIFLLSQSVKEWCLVWALGEVFLVLVGEAADPAFLLQR